MTPKKHTPNARRVTVYEAKDGWRWYAQAGNWKTFDAAEEGKSAKGRVVAHVQRRYPEAELVVT